MKALKLKYQSEVESAKANIEVYMANPAGIGEHPDLVQAVDSELVKLSTAEDKLKSLESNFPPIETSESEYLAETATSYGGDYYPSGDMYTNPVTGEPMVGDKSDKRQSELDLD
tara:strand:+ start:59 stop:400 length:342 start_codon:yes stop_codon:yes gene_type:complete